MPDTHDHTLLEVLLDSWDRNNTIMLNLLRAIPPGGFDARATASSPSVGQQFAHVHHERLVSVSEEAPEFALAVPNDEWAAETDPHRMAAMLIESATAVRNAIGARVGSGRPLDLQYDHPILLLQLLLWHEAYHHGQIKLALKVGGVPITNDEAGPITWDVWRRRRRMSPGG